MNTPTLSALLAFLATAVLPVLSGACVRLPAQDKQPQDSRIAEAIEDELTLDRAVPAHSIDIEVAAGIATLSGTVDNLLASDRAAAIARTVRGVRAVVHLLQVKRPRDMSAAELKASITAALTTDPATDAHEVRVSTDQQGAALLAGTVQSWAERHLCATVVAGVAGVSSIDNQIDVDHRAVRKDDEIEKEIAARLRWNILVDDGLIVVQCTDGHVRLFGTVGSASERYRARSLAMIEGVRDVAVEDLQVDKWERDSMMRRSKYAVRSNEQVRTALGAALGVDPRVSGFDTTVDVDQGVVTLRGNVDNLKARRAAGEDARKTVGVSRVVNRLRVKPAVELSSQTIAQSVKAALDRHWYFDRGDVGVTVSDGVARLFGRVDSNFERVCADDVAARVAGVVEVKNLIAVRDQRFIAFDPHVDESPMQSFGWYRHEPWRSLDSDDEIERRLGEELWWSPFVNSGDVVMSVDAGVVTISGAVASDVERQAAVKNAYDAGAVWVVNQLTLPDRAATGAETTPDRQ